MQFNSNHRRILFFLTGYIAAGFVLLTIFVALFPTSVIDLEFSEEVQETVNPLLDNIMKAVSWLGNPPVAALMVFATALIFLLFRFKKEALFLLFTMASGLVSTLTKMLVNRPRPADTLVNVVGKTQQQSFPSGHVLFFVVFFGFLLLLMGRLNSLPRILRILISVFSVLLIFTIPFSRVYLGAHWFTDVLGAFLLGLLCLYILGHFYLKEQH